VAGMRSGLAVVCAGIGRLLAFPVLMEIVWKPIDRRHAQMDRRLNAHIAQDSLGASMNSRGKEPRAKRKRH
jgi:hypothetical protein